MVHRAGQVDFSCCVDSHALANGTRIVYGYIYVHSCDVKGTIILFLFLYLASQSEDNTHA